MSGFGRRVELPPVELPPLDWNRVLLGAVLWLSLVALGWLVLAALVYGGVTVWGLL